MTALATFTADQASIDGTSVVILRWTTDTLVAIGDAFELGRVDVNGDTFPIYPIGLFPVLTDPNDYWPAQAMYVVPDALDETDLVFYLKLTADLGGTVTDLWADFTWVDLFTDDARITQATAMSFAKLWERKNSPVGILGGFESGAVNVRAIDPDVESLLVGLRLSTTDLNQQTWPTVDQMRARSGIAATFDDADIQAVLDAAIANITRKVTGARGGRAFA